MTKKLEILAITTMSAIATVIRSNSNRNSNSNVTAVSTAIVATVTVIATMST
jgi:hypothetical protein